MRCSEWHLMEVRWWRAFLNEDRSSEASEGLKKEAASRHRLLAGQGGHEALFDQLRAALVSEGSARKLVGKGPVSATWYLSRGAPHQCSSVLLTVGHCVVTPTVTALSLTHQGARATALVRSRAQQGSFGGLADHERKHSSEPWHPSESDKESENRGTLLD